MVMDFFKSCFYSKKSLKCGISFFRVNYSVFLVFHLHTSQRPQGDKIHKNFPEFNRKVLQLLKKSNIKRLCMTTELAQTRKYISNIFHDKKLCNYLLLLVLEPESVAK